MVTLELSDDEALIVQEILAARRKDLFHEIHRTSHREFRELLRARLEHLEAVLNRLALAEQ